MRRWAERLLALAADGPVGMVTVITTEGSTPRNAGARMLVTADTIAGSIGGGRLEFDEMAQARGLLARLGELGLWHRHLSRVVLGPDAGQCCGGVVEVLHEVFGAAEAHTLRGLMRQSKSEITRPLISGTPPRFVIPAQAGTQAACGVLDVRLGSSRHGPRALARRGNNEGRCWSEPLTQLLPTLHLYGAGHTAREIVRIADSLPLDIAWIDMAADRFPHNHSSSAMQVVAAQPADHARAIETGGLHLVMTHSHHLDYAICEALLTRNDFAFLGLIGSATKRARFVQRFRRAGISDDALARLTCPIGLDAIAGKSPAVIALATVAQLVALVPALRE